MKIRNINSTSSAQTNEGKLTANNNQDGGKYQTTTVAELKVRIWGAEGYKLSDKILAGLRQIVREFRPTHPIALMADHHPAEFGIVGSVVASAEKVYPDLIGGDCGCGVYAARVTDEEFPYLRKKLESVYRIIFERVPVGSAQHSEVADSVHQLDFWRILEQAPGIHSREIRRLRHQFGTLGGGNHFIELATDNQQQLWILVHSGSRYLGGLIKQHYTRTILPLESDRTNEFFVLQDAALRYAAASRKAMAIEVLEALQKVYSEQEFLIHEERDLAHNMVALEVHAGTKLAVHRKGACKADIHTKGILPGSMADGSLLVTGRGAAWSYESSSHGAGRKLSRGAAFRELSTAQFFSHMKEIVWAESEQLKDEAPAAYKNLQQVASSQGDLVRIEQKLSTILSVKGVR